MRRQSTPFILHISSHDLDVDYILVERHQEYSASKQWQTSFRSLCTFNVPENLGSDDEAGLHVRRRLGQPERFVHYLRV